MNINRNSLTILALILYQLVYLTSYANTSVPPRSKRSPFQPPNGSDITQLAHPLQHIPVSQLVMVGHIKTSRANYGLIKIHHHATIYTVAIGDSVGLQAGQIQQISATSIQVALPQDINHDSTSTTTLTSIRLTNRSNQGSL